MKMNRIVYFCILQQLDFFYKIYYKFLIKSKDPEPYRHVGSSGSATLHQPLPVLKIILGYRTLYMNVYGYPLVGTQNDDYQYRYWFYNTISVKETVPRDFDFRFFVMNQFPPSPWISLRAASNFFESLRRYSQIKVHYRCHWQRWQMEKIFNQKSFKYLVWTPLGGRVNI